MAPERRDDRPTASMHGVTLRVTNGPEAGRMVQIDTFPCLLGRGGNSQIVLADPDTPPALSREHSTLTQQGAHLIVTDHSTNGTWLDARRLGRRETAIWKPGEVLQLGPTLRLEWRTPSDLSSAWNADQNTLARQEARSKTLPRPPNLKAFLTTPETLQAAWRRVELNRGAAGPDRVTVEEFGREAKRRLAALSALLQSGRYQPMPPRLYAAPKRSGGVRVLSILSVQDRVVQQALHMALQPYLEPLFPPCSFAYRPGSSAHDALRMVDSKLAQRLTWVAETDIADFFDHITHDVLLEQLTAQISDLFTLNLVVRCLAAGAIAPGRGLPQGAATAPLLSNLYLAGFDAHLLAGGYSPVRYGDDLLLLCSSRNQAQLALAEAESYLRAHLRLSLQAEKTRVVPLTASFTFLGFRFTEAGRHAAPQAVAHLAERLEEVEPAQAPAVLRGWRNYFGEEPDALESNPVERNAAEMDNRSGSGASSQGGKPPERRDGTAAPARKPGTLRLGPAATPAAHAASFSMPEEELLLRFVALFSGREEVYARQRRTSKGGMQFVPCVGKLTADLVRAHLIGEETIATYLLRQDGRVQMAVVDIDATTRATGSTSASIASGESDEEAPLSEAARFARDLQRVCHSMGIAAFLEDSGRKGYHLWLFFAEPTEPERARKLARLLVVRAGFPRPGVRVEIFPRHTEWPGPELGDAVKLPLGLHPVTERRCCFLDAAGEPIVDPATAIERLRTISAQTVEAVIQALSRRTDAKITPNQIAENTAGPAVTKLLDSCAVIRALVARAQQTGHLRHTHNLILLYTAGRLGEEGAAFIHRTLSHCRNYHSDICQRYIERLEAEHPPLTCRRIREWLEEEGESRLCTCPSQRRTPLEGIDKEPKAKGQARSKAPSGSGTGSRPSEPEAGVWQAVAADLFADLTSEDGSEAEIAAEDEA